ncbi:hypothetical protein TNCV_5111711 [Trichonephila clavipes]|nr:hypothetical protein TNCV_5111711 [Trichonephila clavipes]
MKNAIHLISFLRNSNKIKVTKKRLRYKKIYADRGSRVFIVGQWRCQGAGSKHIATKDPRVESLIKVNLENLDLMHNKSVAVQIIPVDMEVWIEGTNFHFLPGGTDYGVRH